ncbi:mesothelin-like protein, partial [Electrophorus electricus]|uniref:mesothelin-like protein n=1 Tax=Electrophorus electricus TaxID=8005 RepID=UPI0015D06781
MCMYNYMKDYNLNTFNDYPADMLLYYDYSLIGQSVCQAYFSALGNADFTVFSNTLAFRRQLLFNNARQCLGISGLNISQMQLIVLGNMVCVLNGSYIQNSDPYVLEMLKRCPDLSADQSSAVESMLLTGHTIYGAPTSWNVTTLTNLGSLPLYLSSVFWSQFTMNNKVQFFRTFLPQQIRGSVSRVLISNMMTEAAYSSRPQTKSTYRAKRDTACTMGQITQVQVSDGSFPFGYDVTQFNACLSVQVLKDNLATIAQKAMGSGYQRVILDKLNQAYPTGISNEVLQVLGPASRAATSDDISRWTVTKIDTLSNLMNSTYGSWTPSQVQAIVSKYLSGTGNSLGSFELNALRGAKLCALNTSILTNITSTSLQHAEAISVSNCSLEQKQALFTIAEVAFSDRTLYKSTRATNTISRTSYFLTQSLLGGARLPYVEALCRSNISMDLNTFISLNQEVINALSVPQVKQLLGRNLPDLKTYENASAVHSWVV